MRIVADALTTSHQAFGFFASYKGSLGLVRLYFYGSLVVAALVTGAELARTICHFTLKADILEACAASYSSDVADGSLTTATVESYCRDNWRNSSYVRPLPPLPRCSLTWTLTLALVARRSTSPSSSSRSSSPSSLRPSAPRTCTSSRTCVPSLSLLARSPRTTR